MSTLYIICTLYRLHTVYTIYTMSAMSTRNSVLCPQVAMSGLPTGNMKQAAAEKSTDH